MTTTPADLLAAAAMFLDGDHWQRDADDNAMIYDSLTEERNGRKLADHILATVNPDDDEPAENRDWLESIGAYELDPDGFYFGWSDRAGWILAWGDAYGGWSIRENEVAETLTRGQVRSLLSALKVKVK